MSIKKLGAIVLAGALALSLSACGRTVQPGEVGIKITQFGSGAGVQPEALPTGWHMTGIGEKIETYPTSEKYYQFAKSSKDGNADDESITFSDKNGANVNGDINIKVRVSPSSAPKLIQKYRLDFMNLLDGPIRNDVRTAVARESEKLDATQMVGDGRQQIIAAAWVDVQKKWAPEGVDIGDLQWLGNLRYPKAMEDSIVARLQADQEVAAAVAQEKVAEAQAKTQVAKAQGDAEATRIRGEALRANPQVLRQMEIERWNGQLPNYLAGGNAPFILNKSE